MIVGPYDLTPELFYTLVVQTLDSWRVIFLGVERAPGGGTPAAIAAGVLKRNAGPVLRAGHGHVLEAVNEDGTPYKSFFISCERGLSMAAGQYLELIEAKGPPRAGT